MQEAMILNNGKNGNECKILATWAIWQLSDGKIANKFSFLFGLFDMFFFCLQIKIKKMCIYNCEANPDENNKQMRLTYRCPGLLQSDDASLLESSSSSFDVAIEPVVVCASPPAGDRIVSFFGLKTVVGWPCALWWCCCWCCCCWCWWWWWWWVLVLLPSLLLPLIIVAVGHDVNVFVAVNCVSVMGSIWKHFVKANWMHGRKR